MISLVIKTVLRVLAVLFIGFVCAAVGLIVGASIGAALNPYFHVVFNGGVGYEAGGSIGLILGALIGLIASGARLFGKRTEK